MPRSVGLYLLLVFLGGALLAPWLYQVVQLTAGVFTPLESLARHPFPRYVNRAFLLVGLAGLWPFLRANGLNSFQGLGLSPMRGGLRQLGKGLAFGFVSLAIPALLALAVGPADLDHSRSFATITRRLLQAISSAGFVSVLEEVVFRAALFGALRKRFTWPFALVTSSLLYAGVHFLVRAAPPDSVNWNSGFVVLGRMLGGFLEVRQMVPSFLSLTVAGLILGFCYQFSGRLYLSIGLHAGWIFWLQTNAALTTRDGSTAAWFWGTEKLIDGWFTFFILVALGLTSHFWIGSRRSQGGSRFRA